MKDTKFQTRRYDFPREKAMPHNMDTVDMYSTWGFVISLLLGIMSRIITNEVLSAVAMSISIFAGITTLIRNTTGDTLKTLAYKALARFRNRKSKPK